MQKPQKRRNLLAFAGLKERSAKIIKICVCGIDIMNVHQMSGYFITQLPGILAYGRTKSSCCDLSK